VERYNGKFDFGFFGIPFLKKGKIFPAIEVVSEGKSPTLHRVVQGSVPLPPPIGTTRVGHPNSEGN
jgi:hypothetical protein